jgi:hypothetical protein
MRFYTLSGGDAALALCNARQRRRIVFGSHLRNDAAADRLLPDEDTSRVVVSVRLPPGTQLDDTPARQQTRW